MKTGLINFTVFMFFISSTLSFAQVQTSAEDIMRAMTLREKIAQMVISSSEGYNYDESSNEFQRLKKLVSEEKIGGIIFFRGNSLEQAKLTNRLQSVSSVPLLISADYERGTNMRLLDGSLFPNNMALGATRNPLFAYRMGFLIAKECRTIGVHQNYSPVLDVNNNPDNPIINVRSFGENPQLVSDMGIQMIKGLQDGGVISTAKHFPGHGDTDIDSHNDLPVINFDMARLNEIELVPFRSAIEQGVKSIMIAHLSFPELEKDKRIPASLSAKIVNDLLIAQMNFNGLIVTDALNMSGVTKNFSTEDIAIRCVEAGIDLILMPEDEARAIDAIEKEVIAGKITEERIDVSCRKILENKIQLNLFENKFVDENLVTENINTPEEKALAQQIADESVTLVKDDFVLNKYKSVSVLTINTTKESKSSEYFNEQFKNTFAEVFENINFVNSVGSEVNDELFIIPVFSKVLYKTGTVGIPQENVDMLDSLLLRNKKVVVISFGNPYLLKAFPDVDGYLCTYGDSNFSIDAALKALNGEIPFKGKLPITISSQYKFGFGINKIIK